MKPADLQPGDVCRYDDGHIAYRVEAIITANATKVEARIRWEQDGGLDVRAWDKPDEDVPALVRPGPPAPVEELAGDFLREQLAEAEAADRKIHYDRHSRNLSMEECNVTACRRATRRLAGKS